VRTTHVRRVLGRGGTALLCARAGTGRDSASTALKGCRLNTICLLFIMSPANLHIEVSMGRLPESPLVCLEALWVKVKIVCVRDLPCLPFALFPFLAHLEDALRCALGHAKVAFSKGRVVQCCGGVSESPFPRSHELTQEAVHGHVQELPACDICKEVKVLVEAEDLQEGAKEERERERVERERVRGGE
jgi:hypothetical protein